MVLWNNLNYWWLTDSASLFYKCITFLVVLFPEERQTAINIFDICIKYLVEYLYWVIHIVWSYRRFYLIVLQFLLKSFRKNSHYLVFVEVALKPCIPIIGHDKP